DRRFDIARIDLADDVRDRAIAHGRNSAHVSSGLSDNETRVCRQYKNHHALKNSVKLISKLHGDLYVGLSCAAISGFSVDGAKSTGRVFSNAGNGLHPRWQVRHRRSISELRSRLLLLRQRKLA